MGNYGGGVHDSWSLTDERRRELRIADDRPLWFVSDLHLGDGSPSDTFLGKDRAFLELLDEVDRAGGRLVIVGDAFDFLQAHDLTAVLLAHRPVLRRLAAFPHDRAVVYIVGNHDHDMHVYTDLLRFEVCARLWVGDHALVTHGHQFDPIIGPDLHAAGLFTRVHHGVERLFGTWIRLPLADYYTWAGRFAFWCGHKAWLWLKLRNRVYRWIADQLDAPGLEDLVHRSELNAAYWVRNDLGAGNGMLPGAVAEARRTGARTVICGHSHLPGNFEHQGIRYVNTGSWTFQWSQVVTLQEGVYRCVDRASGREYHDELYRRLLDGELDGLTFDRWWRNQYLGWFRYRTAEARRRYGAAAS